MFPEHRNHGLWLPRKWTRELVKSMLTFTSFVASGDPRNIMCSVNGLPATYEGICSIVVNDKNHNVVARNIVMILLAAQLPPADAAELILHVWYSSRLTQAMIATIDTLARLPIAEVVLKIKHRADDVIQSKTWTFGTAEITVRMYKAQWLTLLDILETKHDITKTEQSRLDTVLAPSRVDYRDWHYLAMTGPRRMCEIRFKETGVLAPFGSCLTNFDSPNP